MHCFRKSQPLAPLTHKRREDQEDSESFLRSDENRTYIVMQMKGTKGEDEESYILYEDHAPAYNN